jgi:hypothetical protein
MRTKAKYGWVTACLQKPEYRERNRWRSPLMETHSALLSKVCQGSVAQALWHKPLRLLAGQSGSSARLTCWAKTDQGTKTDNLILAPNRPIISKSSQ